MDCEKSDKRSQSCCVCGPPIDSNDTKITLHGFPRDSEEREKWSASIRKSLPNFSAKSRYKICSLHFDQNDILGGNQKCIRLGALPTFSRRITEKAAETVSGTNPSRSNQIGFFPDEIPKESRPTTNTNGYEKVKEIPITRICRCCGQLATDLHNMRDRFRLKDGPLLWDWFVKFNYFQSLTLNPRYTHICTVCLTKLVKAYKFHRQCSMAEKIFQDEADRQAAVARSRMPAKIHKMRTVICKTCKKRIPAVHQNRHCKILRRRVQKNSIESRTHPAPAAEIPKDHQDYIIQPPDQVSMGRVQAHFTEPRRARVKPVRTSNSCRTQSDKGNHFCELCGMLILKTNIAVHNRIHHRPKYTRTRKYPTKVVPCKICQKPFMVDNMRSHIQRMHNPTNRNELCPVCGNLFYETKELKLHMMHHANPKPFECTKCVKKYATPHGLRAHFKKEHELCRYKCDDCPEIFTRFSRLKHHVLLRHKGAKLRCHVCFLDTFQTVPTLRRHLQKFHNASYDQSRNYVLPNNETLLRHSSRNGGVIQTCVVEESDNRS